MSEDHSSDTESFAGQLPRELEPPADLEDHVVERLRSEGMLKPSPRHRRARDLVAAAAVLLVGIAIGSYFRPVAIDPPNQPRFLFLLYAAAGAQPGVADEESVAREYGAWAAGLRKAGRLVSGDRLAAEPRIGIGNADARSLDTALQGFFIVGAASFDEAARLAGESPHARHGGRIVVRAIDTP
jgi:hypothetical protein